MGKKTKAPTKVVAGRSMHHGGEYWPGQVRIGRPVGSKEDDETATAQQAANARRILSNERATKGKGIKKAKAEADRTTGRAIAAKKKASKKK